MLKLPVCVSAESFELLPAGRSFSNTVSSPCVLPMPVMVTPSSAPKMVMVSVAVSGVLTPSVMV